MDINAGRMTEELLLWAIGAGAGWAFHWLVKVRRDIDAAHKSIRAILKRIETCQTFHDSDK
jgi:hypothetical protein